MTRRLVAWKRKLGLLLISAGLALTACAPSPPVPWLDRRDLAEIAHCPPPPLIGDGNACGYLAWGTNR